MGGNTKRTSAQVRNLGIHHSGTATGNRDTFERSWRTLGWITGGYHLIILRNGDVEWCYDYSVVTNGIRNHNIGTIHICTVGNGSFTAEQELALDHEIRNIQSIFPQITIDRVLGHNEFAGTATNCPGRNMNTLRARLRQTQTPSPVPTQHASNSTQQSATTHTVVKGDTLTSIGRQHGVSVANLKSWNNLPNSTIRIGQVLRVVSTSSSVSTPTPTPQVTTPSTQTQQRPTLRRGSTGNDVRELQRQLNRHGARPQLVVDGNFGPLTDTAVRNFQRAQRITVDGIVGPISWGRLLS